MFCWLGICCYDRIIFSARAFCLWRWEETAVLNKGRRAERKNEQDPNEIGETARIIKKHRNYNPELNHRVLKAKRWTCNVTNQNFWHDSLIGSIAITTYQLTNMSTCQHVINISTSQPSNFSSAHSNQSRNELLLLLPHLDRHCLNPRVPHRSFDHQSYLPVYMLGNHNPQLTERIIRD